MNRSRLAAPIACLLGSALLAGCQRESPPETELSPPATDTARVQTDPAASDPATPPTPAQAFQCGDRRVEVVADADGAVIDLGDRRVRLEPVAVASGARYAGDGVDWWGKGTEEARLSVDGDILDCVATEARSPWSEARGRDIGFRAVGNEPGWHVEVDMGETPALVVVLDYGERRLEVPASVPFGDDASGETGYRGEADGQSVELRIRREDCSDSMSGEAFEASAELQVDDATYRGCGRYLWE